MNGNSHQRRVQALSKLAQAHGFHGESFAELSEWFKQALNELTTRRMASGVWAHATLGDWRADRPSDKQLSYLSHLGYHGSMPSTKGEAHDIINALVEGQENQPLRRAARAMRLR
jgi:hypothetical protein